MERKISKLIRNRGVWKAITVASENELNGCFGIIDNYELAYPGMSDRWFKHEYLIILKDGNDKDLELNGWFFDKIITVVENKFTGEIRNCIVMSQNKEGEEIECIFSHHIQNMNLIETIFNSIYLVAACNNYPNAEMIIENVLTYLSLWDKDKANEYLQKLLNLKPIIDKMKNEDTFDYGFSLYLSRMVKLQQDTIIDYLKK